MFSISSHICALFACTMSTIFEFTGTLPTDSTLCLCKLIQKARIPSFDDLPGYERHECTGQFCGHLALGLIGLLMMKLWCQTVIDSIKPWQNCRTSAKITFHVVLDSNTDPFQGILPSFVDILPVPQSFQPKFARYKGRALEWCRQHWKLSKSDWILHLDEETQIDEYLVKTCLDFIERGTEDFGMVFGSPSDP